MEKELKTLKLSEINPYENNPRKNESAVEAVAESIRQCGYVAPIVVDEGYTILAGHTRFKAVEMLGWESVECMVCSGLTDEQKKKYRLLDNKTNEFASWDFDALAEELDGLDFDGYDFGLIVEDDDVLESFFNEEPITASEKPPKKMKVVCPKCGEEFEVEL